MKFQRLALILAVIFSNFFAYTQRFGGGEANPNLRTNKEALARFQDNRFGMFLHWGPVSLRGVEIGWSRGTAVSIADYDDLYKEFNPVLFDADAWIKAVKAAGMKYIVITTKHHELLVLKRKNIIILKSMREIMKHLSKESGLTRLMNLGKPV